MGGEMAARPALAIPPSVRDRPLGWRRPTNVGGAGRSCAGRFTECSVVKIGRDLTSEAIETTPVDTEYEQVRSPARPSTRMAGTHGRG